MFLSNTVLEYSLNPKLIIVFNNERYVGSHIVVMELVRKNQSSNQNSVSVDIKYT